VSQPEHPTGDQIADLLEGLTPAPAALELNAHLATCDACAAVRDAIMDVSVVLAAEAATPITMPADVAAALDGAIQRAGRERDAGATPIDPDARRRRRAVRWLTGAAAAVVVAGLVVVGIRQLPHQGTAESSAGTSPAQQQDSALGGAAAGSTFKTAGPNMVPSPGGRLAPPLDVRAAELAKHPASATPPHSVGCSVPKGGGVSSAITFQGRRAVLRIDPARRTATVFDCRTASHVLVATRY
jgi:hypothetical protein